MRWVIVSDAEAARNWDQDLATLPGPSIVQSFGWGSYKATQGWTPLRWAARDGHGPPAAMVQTLVRTYPCRTVVVWCPGGLVGPLEFWNSELLEQVATETRARQLYCRVTFSRERSDQDVDSLRARGWVPPRRPVSASRTMIWELPPTEEEMVAGLRPNWRHNLKRALKRNLRVVCWSNPSAASIAHVFETMAAYKDVGSYFDASSLTALFQSLPGQIVVYGCENDARVPLAVRGCAIQGGSAWDLLAATSPEGRHCYASYSVFWALVRHCRDLDVKRYDLSGVDPVGAPGVYTFKRGTGAREQECLGEWEWATSSLLARLVNLRAGHRPAAALP